MSYSYLDGSQTGALLSGQPINSAPGNYIPGQGTAPYAPLGINNAVGGAVSGASNAPAWNPGMGISQNAYNSWVQQMIANGQGALISSGANSGANPNPINSFPGGNSLGTSATDSAGGSIGNGGPTINNSGSTSQYTPIGPFGNGSSGSGGGGGGSAGAGSGSSGGNTRTGLLSGGVANPYNYGSSGINAMQTANPGQLSYQTPQNMAPAPGQAGSLNMQQANPQSGLNAYQNSTGYQLLNAAGAYQSSPGYQFAVNDAMKQVQQNASSRGLLDSGNAMQSMLDRAQGMALQDYGNWWNRQSQQYSDYQNRLAGLAGGQTGGDQANTLGQSLGQNNALTGSNLGSLFGNQGTIALGGITGTGAAQANSINQAANQQVQVNAANQSTQLAGAASAGRF